MREILAAAALLTCSTIIAAPKAAADPAAVDPLVISVEDVRAIAGNNDLTPGPMLDAPGGQHQFDAQYPSQCHAVFNQDVAFSPGFSDFRSVTYTGPADRAVTQAVAVYPDEKAARAALTTLGSSLKACSELAVPDLTVTTQVLDSKTFALCQAQCATLYRAAGPVLIGVNAVRFGDSDRIATAVLQQISTRVNDA
jgi:hypothetical protein